MVKLVVRRRFPFVLLIDIGLRRQVDRLTQANEELRARITDAHEERQAACKQADELRKQKERLRLRVVALKQEAAAERKVLELQNSKIQALREEIEELKASG